MKWRTRQGAELLWRSWDTDEILVFDVTSGDTHLVNDLTAEILQVLDRASLDVNGLCREIAGSLSPGDESDEFQSNVAKLLDHLDRLGLVEPAP